MIVNGRFLRARPTGVHRTARSLLAAAVAAGLDAQVLSPRRLPAAGLGGQAWEQVALPALARGRPVLSLANTAPLAVRRGAVLVHDLAPLVGPDWFVPAMASYGRLVLAGGRRARVVLTVSEQVRAELATRGVGTAHLVRPALDPSFVPASPAEVDAVRDRLNLAGPFLLLVGWADPRKDAATALAAHLQVAASHPHTLLLVGGRHPVFAPVDLPPAPTVRTLDYVDDPTLRVLLSAAVALVYPSRYEGFGLPPLEAWACGSPALVSDLPALRESTRGLARYTPTGDVPAWAEAMAEALEGRLDVPVPPPWTWADAAGQLLAALAPLR